MKLNQEKLTLSQETVRSLTETSLRNIIDTRTCVCGPCTCPPPQL